MEDDKKVPIDYKDLYERQLVVTRVLGEQVKFSQDKVQEGIRYKQAYRDQLGVTEILAKQLAASQERLSDMEFRYATAINKLRKELKYLKEKLSDSEPLEEEKIKRDDQQNPSPENQFQ